MAKRLMDQDATWRGGRPRPRPHCVRWGPSSPPQKRHSPQFSAHVCCGQMAGWIKMPRGTGWHGNIVLDGYPAPPLRKKGAQHPQFWPMSIVNGWIDQGETWDGSRPRPRPYCVRWGPSSPPTKGAQPNPSFWPMPVVAKWLDG